MGKVLGKVLVLYDSASGNTAKMAGLVAEGAGSIPGVEVRLRKVEEATPEDVLWCDGRAYVCSRTLAHIPLPTTGNLGTGPGCTYFPAAEAITGSHGSQFFRG
jgi:hypothetical protein